VYTDASGARHPWSINAAHALIWNDKPFLPVGGVFQARSWAAMPTDEDWAGDVAALRVLKERGVLDLYVQPARGGITGVPPTAIQRLLDHLDAEGFTYGISLNDGPRQPLIGYMVRPGAFRQANVTGGALLRFPIADLFSSLYFVVDARASGEVIDAGEAALVSEGARVTVPARSGSGGGDLVVFLVPEKVYLPHGGLGLPNLWDGFDDYRDGLLTLFAGVKLGKGFRFFVDPLGADLAPREEAERLIPSGDGFATEWAAWLARKYKNVDTLQIAWGLPERPLTEFRDAAALIPLWSGGKGVEAYHHKKNGQRFKAASTRSAFWNDLETFKNESIRGYMNALADVLKKEVANVPVVYRWNGTSPLFAHLPAQNGFDGLGIEAYGRGSELVTHSGGYAYAQAAQSPKTLWLPVTGTQDTRSAAKPDKGYPSRAALFADLDWLREIGAKGFFVHGLQIVDPGRAHFSLVAVPDQLTWLRDYKAMLGALTGGAHQRPNVVPFPRGLAVASLRPLAGGGWWLPTDRPATPFDFGPAGRVYGLETEQGTVYYLWNPAGTRQVRLRLPRPTKDPDAPRVEVAGAPPGKISKDILTLTIGPEPISIRNLPYLPVPLEAFPEMLKEAEALVALARRQGRPEAALFLERLSTVRDKYREDNPLAGVSALAEFLQVARFILRPYAWIEAENAATHAFDETTDRAGASGGHVLRAGDRGASGTATAATATYPIVFDRAGTFHLWAAGTAGALLTFRVDGQPISAAPSPETRGAAYSEGLVWTRFGTVTVTKGLHTLEVRADGPATLDVLLLTPDEFAPDGPNPPPVLPPVGAPATGATAAPGKQP
jgi:hypothetical protein